MAIGTWNLNTYKARNLIHKINDNTNLLRVFSRDDVGISPNFDNPGFNGYFEVRASSETTGESGTKPFNSYAGLLTMKDPSNVSMMQLAGSNAQGWWVRGKQTTNVTLSGVDWQRIVVADSGTYEINISGHAEAATNLYADDSPYRYTDSHPYYAHMSYNTNGDNMWYLRVYPETPKAIAVDWAYNATNAAKAAYLPTKYDGGQKTNPQTYFSNTIGLRVAMTGSWSVWSDTLWINGYSGGDVKSMCALHFLRNGEPRLAITTQQDTATSYGTYYEIPSTYNRDSWLDGSTHVLHSYDWWVYEHSHNVNTLVQGMTFAYTSHNAPTTGIIVAFNSATNQGYPMQIMGQYGGYNMYYRHKNGDNGTWPAWKHIWIEGNSVTSAVWNDYAEARESLCTEPGYVVQETGSDTLALVTERLAPCAGIVSDTWGFSQGETDSAKTHIAVAGRVLAYPYRDRSEYKPGDVLCAAPGGTVDIMTREEIIQYPDRIVGTVSCVPDYDEWGGGEGADRPPVKVNGRIWVKVK